MKSYKAYRGTPVLLLLALINIDEVYSALSIVNRRRYNALLPLAAM